MPIAVDQISKRYMVCLLCLHYKFSVFLPKMPQGAPKIENLYVILVMKYREN